MKKFLVLFKASAEEFATAMKATPDQAKAGMDAWMAWSKKAGSAVVDLGQPVGNGATVAKDGTTGKGTTIVGGYSIMQAESLADLAKVLVDHPHFMMPGGSIEVLEAFNIM